ncbi:MAG: carboxypeptidase regulatory-like domain-containing protein, partial [Planctomycetota bacterium]
LGADSTVESCVVYLKGPLPPVGWKKARDGGYEVDQKGCHYVPRVLIVPVGETVTFKSSDPIGHNVKSAYKSFNVAVSQDGPQKLLCDQADFVEVGCSIHPFMSGLVVVAAHPWYVLSDAKGEFKLDGVPPGAWTIFGRHEVLGKHAKMGTPITVEANKETTVDLTFD